MNVIEGITEEKISQMVSQFYRRVRNDDLLGPVFGAQIQDHEWPDHLAVMCDFWSSVLLATGRYRGNPRETHMSLPEIAPEHFDRWLDLFELTLGEVFDEGAANHIHARAHRMRDVLQEAACS